MNPDELDDGSMVINFDATDEYNIPTKQSGYVIVRQEDEDKCFIVTVFNAEGDVLSETPVPFNFREF